MNNLDEVIIFKDNLKNLKRYKSRIEHLKAELFVAEHNQIGVYGVDTSKETSSSSTPRDSIIIGYINRIDILKSRINAIQMQINYIEWVLNLMDEQDRNMIYDIYVKGVSYYEMSLRVGYSETGLKRKVNEIIKSVLSPHF